MEHVEAHGGRIILMASRALCRIAKGRDDYLAVYGRLIAQARQPVILHWLGDMFDPHWRDTGARTMSTRPWPPACP